jgi:hypothetical protein
MQREHGLYSLSMDDILFLESMCIIIATRAGSSGDKR